ncbi:Crp/Fnr family transcriptional regulator [Paremcibacter congregatus]|uniref:Crp/Fnr family transcriptional regulator n=1 Tax=Paremcibacter congregatus TaxID=2043170 RepID=A0A2G4YMC4_9PROT|nr:Crp/Fnr family transcriptional regulator [Paremcibacter congregatus]PHZ83447.1 Crp/Fnr family transcriptional regulator [Paremcibacter congregatus]QDE28085.1 Crp/Fnr family transcriptional regulator [Paremcibacter congregatus]
MLEKIISHFPQLAHLSEDNKKILAQGLHYSKVPKGTTMFSEGSECRGYVMLLHGIVRVQKTSEDGREITLYRVEEGDSCIMTTTCLISDENYSAEGIAETDIEVAVVPPATFNLLLGQSDQFRSFVFETYAKRMSMLMMLVEEVVFKKLDKRLAHMLLESKHDLYTATHHDIATELGSVREVVSRQLKVFERQGLIELGRGVIHIRDRAGLAETAR